MTAEDARALRVPSSVDALGTPVALGRTAEIFALPGARVLKLFAAQVPAADVLTEQTNSTEAVELGATPLVCHGQVEIEERRGLVFDAADGGSLNSVAERNLLRLRAVGRILAREHAALHRQSTLAHEDVRAAAAALLDREALAALGPELVGKVAEQLAALPDGGVLLHMDFHTQNVFAHADGWAVIDWQTSMRGAAAADVAMTMLLLRDAELWPGTPRLKQLLYDAVRRTLASAYLAEYLAVTGTTAAQVQRWRLAALVLRLGTWQIASEREHFSAEIRALAAAER